MTLAPNLKWKVVVCAGMSINIFVRMALCTYMSHMAPGKLSQFLSGMSSVRRVKNMKMEEKLYFSVNLSSVKPTSLDAHRFYAVE